MGDIIRKISRVDQAVCWPDFTAPYSTKPSAELSSRFRLTLSCCSTTSTVEEVQWYWYARYDTALLRNLITYISACITSFPDAWERDLPYTFMPRIFQPSSNARAAVYALRVLPPCTRSCLISMLSHQQASSTVSGPVPACAHSQIFIFQPG